MNDEVKKYMSELGKKRFKGKTSEEISKMMSDVRKKGLKNKSEAKTAT